jgi:hypothetical protein
VCDYLVLEVMCHSAKHPVVRGLTADILRAVNVGEQSRVVQYLNALFFVHTSVCEGL